MYDELVKQLRAQAVYLPEKFSKNAELLDVLMKAADAIEELLSKLNHDDAQIQSLVEAAEERRWIPVTERLPEEWWPVLGLIQYHDEKEPPSQQVLWYLGNGHWRETWRGDMIESDVTHWMPLPSTDGLNET